MSEIALVPVAPKAAAAAVPREPSARRRIGLSVKLAAALVGLVVLVLLVNGAIGLWLSYGEAKNAALGVQQEKAQAAAQRVGEFIAEIENEIGWTTRLEWSRLPLEQQRYDFARLLRQVPGITELSYLDTKGKEQLKVSRVEADAVASGRDLSSDPRFVKAVAEKTWFGPVYFRRGSEPYMTIAVAHAGREPGVTVAEVNLKLIWDVITSIRVGEKGYAYIIDARGRLVAHPDLSLVLRETDFSRLAQVRQALAKPAPDSGTGAIPGPSAENAEIATGYEGGSVLTAYAQVPRLHWNVFVQLPLAEVLAPVYASLFQTLALLGLGLLLALTAGGYLARRLVVPIRHLQEGAERLGGGDLTQRLDIRTGDEIETLAERFNEMAGRVQESHETLEAKVETRTKDLNEALQRQTATAEVLKVISRSAFDLNSVLDTLVASAAKLCAAYAGAVFLREGELFHAKAVYGGGPQLLEFLMGNPMKAGRESMTPRVILSGKIEQIPDALLDPEFVFPGLEANNPGRALIGVPLLRDGRLEGVFVLTRNVPGLFSESEVNLLQTFADQAVIAIENVRLFEQVQAKTRDLTEALQQQTATADVLKVISRSAFDLDAVMNTLTRSAVELCDAEIGSLHLREGDVLVARGISNSDPTAAAYLRDTPVPINEHTNVGRSVLHGSISNIADYRAGEGLRSQSYQDVIGFRSFLCVPLMRDGRGVGVFSLGRKRVAKFSQRQIELLQTFADQAVIAIENVRLFEQVQAKTRDLSEALEQQTATADVLKVISRSTFDLQTVLDTLVGSAARLCEAEKACIFQREGELYRWVSNFGFPDELVQYAQAHPFAAGPNSTTGRVALEGKPIQVADVLADPDYTASEYQRLGNYRTNLGVPLLREGVPIGVFVMTRQEVRPFNERQIELLQTFADQAVIAIENVRLFEETQARTKELARSIEELRAAQDRLIQSEKLASLGQLTAGIAHEIKNPLNFVNNFASLSCELIEELKPLVATANASAKVEIDELTQMLESNLEKVMQHGKRADSIVKNMLLHSRESSGEHRPVDLNALVEESVNLAYHGARAEKPGFNITLVKNLDPAVGEVDLYPQEFTRVLLNLISNGFYAATKRKAEKGGEHFQPTLTAATRGLGDKVEIKVRDNGTGIPDEVRAKMFNPFFTTKPAGEGTGLGLSLSHDIIVKQHGGTIAVETEPGAFTEFTIVIPRGGNPATRQHGAS